MAMPGKGAGAELLARMLLAASVVLALGILFLACLWPVSITDFWWQAAATREPNAYARLVNNIGNIVPLDDRTNIAGSNAPWSVKCELYRKHVPNWLVAGIAADHPDGWTPEMISARADALAVWAVTQRWPLAEALQELEA